MATKTEQQVLIPSSWLVNSQCRFAISVRPLRIGRSDTCDLVLLCDEVSREHALVYLSGGVPVIYARGFNPVSIDGAWIPNQQEYLLKPGMVIRIASETFQVVTDFEGTVAARSDAWYFVLSSTILRRVSKLPFRVGGAGNDLMVHGWPEQALSLDETAGSMHLLLEAEGHVDGALWPAGSSIPVQRQIEIKFGDHEIALSPYGYLQSGVPDPTYIPNVNVSYRNCIKYSEVTFQFGSSGQCHTFTLPGNRGYLMQFLLEPYLKNWHRKKPHQDRCWIERSDAQRLLFGKNHVENENAVDNFNNVLKLLRNDLTRPPYFAGRKLIQSDLHNGRIRLFLPTSWKVSLSR